MSARVCAGVRLLLGFGGRFRFGCAVSGAAECLDELVDLTVLPFRGTGRLCEFVVCCGVGDLFSAEVGFESGDVELPEPAAFGEWFGAECADESDGSACAVDDFLG